MENKELGISGIYIKWKFIGLIIGLLWIGLTIYSRMNGAFFDVEKLSTLLKIQLITQIVAFILRIYSVMTCYTLAKVGLLPFNKSLWAILALFLPHIALIIGGVLPVKNYKSELNE